MREDHQAEEHWVHFPGWHNKGDYSSLEDPNEPVDHEFPSGAQDGEGKQMPHTPLVVVEKPEEIICLEGDEQIRDGEN